MRRDTSLVLAIGAAATLSAGCSDTEAAPEGAAGVRTDSAGVSIVATIRSAWADGGGWTVEAEPSLVIGQLEGEEPYLFGEVRGAVRLDDGSVVVVDRQPRELRWFDSTGVFVRQAGGIGEGPGEIPDLWNVARCGTNRIEVHDPWSRLAMFWDTAGVHQRRFQLLDPTQPTSGVYNHACDDEGGFVAVGWGDRQAIPPAPEEGEAYRYSQYAPVWGLDSLGALRHEYGEFLSSERIRYSGGASPHPFGRAVKFAAGGGRVFVGTGEGLAIGVYEDGELRQLWRAKGGKLRVGESFREDYARADSVVEQFRDWILNGLVEMPPELPAFTELRVTPAGHLWAKRFVVPWESHNRWGVFAPDGVFLGDVELPVELTVTDIGDDYVLGVAADELDVQRVQLHPIRR